MIFFLFGVFSHIVNFKKLVMVIRIRPLASHRYFQFYRLVNFPFLQGATGF